MREGLQTTRGLKRSIKCSDLAQMETSRMSLTEQLRAVAKRRRLTKYSSLASSTAAAVDSSASFAVNATSSSNVSLGKTPAQLWKSIESSRPATAALEALSVELSFPMLPDIEAADVLFSAYVLPSQTIPISTNGGSSPMSPFTQQYCKSTFTSKGIRRSPVTRIAYSA